MSKVSDHSADKGRPMSEIIRERIRASGKRFNANDNISTFIKSDSELSALQDEVATSFESVLRSLVIDVDTDHNTNDTARRVAKMYLREVFAGRYQPSPKMTEFPNVERIDELIVVGPITTRSACSHHFCPIMGKLWVGILPRAESTLIGLSKYTRIAEWVMSRPQIQEEAVKMLADTLENHIKPEGLALVVRASHFCVHWRGVKDLSAMTSSVMRGAFLKSEPLRKEFLTLAKIE